MNIARALRFNPSSQPPSKSEIEKFLGLEWLVTNGLGGYSSSSISGITTRKYHGLLVAALPPPLGRSIMLNHLSEQIILPDSKRYFLSCEEHSNGEMQLEGMQYLKEFRLEFGLPCWLYDVHGILIEKRILFVHMQNTVHISYRLLSSHTHIQLELRPVIHFRPHESPVNAIIREPYTLTVVNHQYEISNSFYPPLRICIAEKSENFIVESQLLKALFFRCEFSRGYESAGELWSPGYLKVNLEESVTFIASTENWKAIHTLTPQNAIQAENKRRHELIKSSPLANKTALTAELILAADQFIIQPCHRVEDLTRTRAIGEEFRTIIAGYHWFTDWGRDTMISLEGLTLLTGRYHEARWILRTFQHYIKDGLLPNMFPEGENQGLYHTADATLWFFHAIDRYVEFTKDYETLRELLPTLFSIISFHIKGTRFGIQVDPTDGLLVQGAEGYQLTWMDAKVGDWVVTPRRGKAVEINALWYNALRLLENWLNKEKDVENAHFIREQAEKVYTSFNAFFWYAEGKYLYDVIATKCKENDPACRPNQIFSICLKHPVLDPIYWPAIMDKVKSELLTPYGLRSLSPRHPEYKPRYDGDLRSRDAAYHQGTVWTWLIGPFIDAWLKTYPHTQTEARHFLSAFKKHLGEAGVGSISEIFDATVPYTPRGCIAQAWSVSELLRAWVKTSSSKL